MSASNKLKPQPSSRIAIAARAFFERLHRQEKRTGSMLTLAQMLQR